MTSATLVLPHEIGAGPDREVQILLADRWGKLVLIQLRRSALLADHTARVPITIQTIAGKGVLRLGGETHVLSPGGPRPSRCAHSAQRPGRP
jgi:quercetin dioxygenase-like cupin family protein